MQEQGQQRTYEVRAPCDPSGYVVGTRQFANGTTRTVEDLGNGLVRVTWDDAGFWAKH